MLFAFFCYVDAFNRAYWINTVFPAQPNKHIYILHVACHIKFAHGDHIETDRDNMIGRGYCASPDEACCLNRPVTVRSIEENVSRAFDMNLLDIEDLSLNAIDLA